MIKWRDFRWSLNGRVAAPDWRGGDTLISVINNAHSLVSMAWLMVVVVATADVTTTLIDGGLNHAIIWLLVLHGCSLRLGVGHVGARGLFWIISGCLVVVRG